MCENVTCGLLPIGMSTLISSQVTNSTSKSGMNHVMAHSNSCFFGFLSSISNGLLDPWYSGGVTGKVSPTTYVVIMENAAHHLDLRASNPNDPPDVVKARKLYANIFKRWIREYRKKYRISTSPYDQYLSSLNN